MNKLKLSVFIEMKQGSENKEIIKNILFENKGIFFAMKDNESFCLLRCKKNNEDGEALIFQSEYEEEEGRIAFISKKTYQKKYKGYLIELTEY